MNRSSGIALAPTLSANGLLDYKSFSKTQIIIIVVV